MRERESAGTVSSEVAYCVVSLKRSWMVWMHFHALMSVVVEQLRLVLSLSLERT